MGIIILTAPSSTDEVTITNGLSGLEVKDNGIDISKLGDVYKWELISEQDYAADATKAFTALTAKKKYLIVITDLIPTAGGGLNMTINSVGGTAYRHTLIDTSAATIASTTGLAFWKIANMHSQTRMNGNMVLDGLGGDTAITGRPLITGADGEQGYYCYMTPGAGNVQVSRIDISASAGTLTGNIKIYGSD